jgi:hypothetical protein
MSRRGKVIRKRKLCRQCRVVTVAHWLWSETLAKHRVNYTGELVFTQLHAGGTDLVCKKCAGGRSEAGDTGSTHGPR